MNLLSIIGDAAAITENKKLPPEMVVFCEKLLEAMHIAAVSYLDAHSELSVNFSISDQASYDRSTRNLTLTFSITPTA